ncbi:fimbrillin family protein [Phocaeicola plebeius]|uniref:fimbrillin family protein n=1 Tax=Phocaeicola plebeius TaxID=310297 RepID=UPI0021ABB31D|nr:fimbrillin family protein [Phocaeicola plebeius]MCR8884697.1 fimbrillin family protein [Phocaeicola plebeius]MDM8286244.1 fimbrillin family protein [Phocaeicola plebeius]
MKRRIFTYSTFVLLLGLSACTQDGLPTDGAEGTPITFTATGLDFPEARSRATVDGDWAGVNKVAVKIGDEVKEYTVTIASGDNTSVTLKSDNPFYITMTESKTVSAWWPYIDSSSSDMPEVLVKADQSDEGFVQSDYIEANQTVSYDDTSLNFTHRTARMKIKLVPGAGFATVDDAMVSLVNLSNVENNPTTIIPYESSANVYEALVAPQTIAMNNAFICVELANNKFYYPSSTDLDLLAGNRYNYTLSVNATGLELEEVSGGAWTDSGESEDVTSREILVRYTADEVKKGDYIYQDGTTSDGGLRLIYADGTMVTTPEKPQPKNDDANPVVGIVFWTPSETTPQKDRQTPARLTDDKIMSADHPDCIHGLAVALKNATYNGSERMGWQNSFESVATTFQSGENFSHDSKGNFKSIASESGEYDPMNYILGYQNTVVLRAYNTYCQNNDKSDYIVRPVAAIDDFDDTNPAPDNSTGWFLPSPKELHILYYKDVDNIYNNSGVETYNIVNSSLTAAGGDRLYGNWYWSSGENGSSYAWYVYLSNGSVYYSSKNYYNYVRLAFAF